MSITDKLITISENEHKVYDSGYSKGQLIELENLWTRITANNTRSNFEYAFARTDYSDVVFTQPIVPRTNVSNMFYYYLGAKVPGNIDLSKISTTATHGAIFARSSLEEIYDLKIPPISYSNTYLSCTKLKKIAKIRVNENTAFSSAFSGCTALEEVTFEGQIGKSISFNNCSSLTLSTLKHIISTLVDYAGTDKEFDYTITLNSSSVSILEQEGSTSPNGNTWRQYAVDKGWNIS